MKSISSLLRSPLILYSVILTSVGSLNCLICRITTYLSLESSWNINQEQQFLKSRKKKRPASLGSFPSTSSINLCKYHCFPISTTGRPCLANSTTSSSSLTIPTLPWTKKIIEPSNQIICRTMEVSPYYILQLYSHRVCSRHQKPQVLNTNHKSPGLGS